MANLEASVKPRHESRRWLSRLSIISLLLLALVTADGCFVAQWQLIATNDSGQDWLIRVPQAGSQADTAWVSVLLDGQSGVATEWRGEFTQTVQLLSHDCTVVGTFVKTGDSTYAVPEVHGVVATVIAFGTGDSGGRPEPLQQTGECGGQGPAI